MFTALALITLVITLVKVSLSIHVMDKESSKILEQVKC